MNVKEAQKLQKESLVAKMIEKNLYIDKHIHEAMNIVNNVLIKWIANCPQEDCIRVNYLFDGGIVNLEDKKMVNACKYECIKRLTEQGYTYDNWYAGGIISWAEQEHKSRFTWLKKLFRIK